MSGGPGQSDPLADTAAPEDLGRTRASQPRLGIGSTLGRYVIKDVLGAGGMGVVYRAHDPELGRLIALKVVHPGDGTSSQSQGRLVREAQAMARVAHPNVIVVHDAGTVANQVFVAMELVDGSNLDAWQKERPRSWRELVEVYVQAGRGLAAAHAAGLVHRDFKPANTLVGRDGRVRVLDFGLARAIDQAPAPDAVGVTQIPVDQPALTHTGAVMGTPQFMSPEQHGGTEIDARSDQFSFCVALYHALFGEYPFRGASYGELAASVRSGRVGPPPGSAKVPGFLIKALRRGLSTDPKDRFPSVNELLAAIAAGVRRGRARRVMTAAVAAIGILAIVMILLARRHVTRDAPTAMAFANNHQVVTLTGELVAAPSLSPDGRWFAYGTVTGVAFRDLTNGELIERREWRQIADVRWSPRGDVVLLATEHGPEIMARDGSDPKVFPLPCMTCRGAWSPDATEIIWYMDDGWRLLTVATGKVRPFSIALPEDARITDVDWSTTGELAIATTRKAGRVDLWIARADGSGLTKVGEDASASTLRWNATGTRLYYSRGAASGFEVVHRDPRDPQAAPVVVLVQPRGEFSGGPVFALSRDERTLIFLQSEIGHHLVHIDLAGQVPIVQRLTTDRQLKIALAVAPDQASVAFASGIATEKRLSRIPLRGGAVVPLPVPPGDIRAAAFSPTGSDLAFTQVRGEAVELWILTLATGAVRKLDVPQLEPNQVTWLANGTLLIARDDFLNFVVIDPATGVGRPMWSSEPAIPLGPPMAIDGDRIVAAVQTSEESGDLILFSGPGGQTRVVSPNSAKFPMSWSEDGRWIYANEQPTDDAQLRIVAISAAGDGASRLLLVTEPAVSPVVLAKEKAVVAFVEDHKADFWMATVDPRPMLPRGPPVLPVAPLPSTFLAVPTNLALGGKVGAAPDGWSGVGTPAAPVVTDDCGRPGLCVVLESASGATLAQRIDATPYRGRRIRVAFDVRLERATGIVNVDSGIYAVSEIPAGILRLSEQRSWERREFVADIAPDALYIELKMIARGAGKLWFGNFALDLAVRRDAAAPEPP